MSHLDSERPCATFCIIEAVCRARKLNAELANGRLAMMAIIGMSLAAVQGTISQSEQICNVSNCGF